MAVIRSRTAGARTLPELARQTIVSWSPACPGNACSSRFSAVVEPVPGRVRASEYVDPAARPVTPRTASSASHPIRTQARRWTHQRAIAAMSVPCPLRQLDLLTRHQCLIYERERIALRQWCKLGSMARSAAIQDRVAEAILDVAADLLARGGEPPSMADIAAAAAWAGRPCTGTSPPASSCCRP